MKTVRTVAIVGGGRWARVIATVLDGILPAAARITMHSPRNSAGLREWYKAAGIDRLTVSETWPRRGDSEFPDAAIIANDAKSHVSATVSALLAGIPTLVEKPFALSAKEAAMLTDVAQQMGTPVFAGHVFVFARYITTFAHRVRELGLISRIEIVWSDPPSEVRHGEDKYYDPTISVIQDVLPHVLSLLRAVSLSPFSLEGVTIYRGGAKVRLNLLVGKCVCVATIERHGTARRRSIQINAAAGCIDLDFGIEPGTILCGDSLVNGDPDWQCADSPLTTMLKTFIESVEVGGAGDERLSSQLGIEFCHVVDQAAERYRAELAKWFSRKLGQPIDDELRYLLLELGMVNL